MAPNGGILRNIYIENPYRTTAGRVDSNTTWWRVHEAWWSILSLAGVPNLFLLLSLFMDFVTFCGFVLWHHL